MLYFQNKIKKNKNQIRNYKKLKKLLKRKIEKSQNFVQKLP